ncbi:unnamed protein product [Rhizoctonia solani]|uniref:Uncharacterized protein n=1 Tax=Rhizoctonia solani TaxID=456999 RepID=A0A8H2Y3W2_9AGAM|nr:unnamed protein product [Rhizoctonia solani]
MPLASAVESAFAKLGIVHGYQYPHDPYDPTKRLRRVSSHISVRQRKPSIVESACLGAHKIPAIVAASGSPEASSPEKGLPSPPMAARNSRHSIAGWHRLLSQDDAGTTNSHAFPRQTAQPNTDAPAGPRGDRSHTVPAAINVSASLGRDQTKLPYSAPSHTTSFGPPEIQVTVAERWPAEIQHQYASPVSNASYDFTDMDGGSRIPPSTPGPSSPPNSTRRPPSPAMSQSYRSISPTAGHTPHHPGSHRRESSLRTNHAPPQRSITPSRRTNPAPQTAQTAIPESYDFTSTDRLSPTTPHENPKYGGYYSTSPVPILTYGNTRGNTYDSRPKGAYDATQTGSYASRRDTYDTMQEDGYDPARRHGAATYITHGQETGLTSTFRDLEDYNRDRIPRSMLAPFPSPTTTVSVDGTLDSPYLDRDSTSPNSF